jgi:pilus assembly protein CpaC
VVCAAALLIFAFTEAAARPRAAFAAAQGAQESAGAGSAGDAASEAPAPESSQPVDSAIANGSSLHLLVGRSLIITSPTRIKRVSLADPALAEAEVVSPYEVMLDGKAPGGVSLVIWDEFDRSRQFDVSVDIDVVTLRQELQQAFPSEPIQIEATKDALIVSGKISSAAVEV